MSMEEPGGVPVCCAGCGHEAAGDVTWVPGWRCASCAADDPDDEPIAPARIAIRRIGDVADIDGIPCSVGVAYGSVYIATGQGMARFRQAGALEFAAMFAAACWQAWRPQDMAGSDG